MHQSIVVYLDTDINGDDLLDSASEPIEQGWYRYDWPLSGANNSKPIGPFETELDAGDGIAL